MNAKDTLDAMYTDVPLIFGHRGAKADAPDNTLPAFELAVQQGAHGIELDVQRSKDGYPVVIHDFTVDGTTDGSGRVAEMTLAQLKALDAGSYLSPEFAGTRIPTLDEVFEAVGQRLFINVEIKSIAQETDGVEQVIADCIQRHNMQARVIVSSFNPFALKRFRAILPDVPLGFLYAQGSPDAVYEMMRDFAVEALHPQAAMIDAATIEKAHAAGQRVNAWTVNDVTQAAALRDLGVDALISDAPGQLLAGLR